MIQKTRTAANLGQKAAAQTKLLTKSYLNSKILSSQLKQEIGEILLRLEFLQEPALQYIGLGLFEEMLRQYIDARFSGAVQ